MSAQVKSAQALVSTSGVLVTTMSRARHAGTSMLLKPTATLATTFERGAGGIEHGRVDRLGEQADERVLAGHPRQQRVTRDRRGLGMEVELADGFETIEHR